MGLAARTPTTTIPSSSPSAAAAEGGGGTAGINKKTMQELFDDCRRGQTQRVQSWITQKGKKQRSPLSFLRVVNGSFSSSSSALSLPASGWLCGLRQPSTSHTLLHLAALHGHGELSRLLVERDEQLVRARDRKGCLPLHLAAWNGHCQVVEILLDADPDKVNAVDNAKQTALHLAILNGNAQVVRLLLQRHCDARLRNANHESPLDIAVRTGKFNICQLLLIHCPSIALQCASDCCPSSAFASASPSIPNYPLHVAAKLGHFDCLAALLSHGFNVNFLDKEGTTALQAAIKKGQIQTVNLLLQNGFDIRIRDNEGRTVIEWLNEELQKERNKIPSGQLEMDKLKECQGILMEYAKMRERTPSAEGRKNGMEEEGGGGIIRQESDRNWKKLAIEKADRNEGRGMNKQENGTEGKREAIASLLATAPSLSSPSSPAPFGFVPPSSPPCVYQPILQSNGNARGPEPIKPMDYKNVPAPPSLLYDNAPIGLAQRKWQHNCQHAPSPSSINLRQSNNNIVSPPVVPEHKMPDELDSIQKNPWNRAGGKNAPLAKQEDELTTTTTTTTPSTCTTQPNSPERMGNEEASSSSSFSSTSSMTIVNIKNSQQHKQQQGRHHHPHHRQSSPAEDSHGIGCLPMPSCQSIASLALGAASTITSSPSSPLHCSSPSFGRREASSISSVSSSSLLPLHHHQQLPAYHPLTSTSTATPSTLPILPIQSAEQPQPQQCASCLSSAKAAANSLPSLGQSRKDGVQQQFKQTHSNSDQSRILQKGQPTNGGRRRPINRVAGAFNDPNQQMNGSRIWQREFKKEENEEEEMPNMNGHDHDGIQANGGGRSMFIGKKDEEMTQAREEIRWKEIDDLLCAIQGESFLPSVNCDPPQSHSFPIGLMEKMSPQTDFPTNSPHLMIWTIQRIVDWLKEDVGFNDIEDGGRAAQQIGQIFFRNGFDRLEFMKGSLNTKLMTEMGIDRKSQLRICRHLNDPMAIPEGNEGNTAIQSATNFEFVSDWLVSLRLLDYLGYFSRANLISIADLVAANLTRGDFEKMGITLLGHCSRIIHSLDLARNHRNKQQRRKHSEQQSKSSTVTSSSPLPRENRENSISAESNASGTINSSSSRCSSTTRTRAASLSPQIDIAELRARITKGCVRFSAHYLGSSEISNVEGTEDCRRAMIVAKEKASQLKDVPYVFMEISVSGINILDKNEKTIDHQPISDIQVVCQDQIDLNCFAYIFKNGDRHFSHVFCVLTAMVAKEVIITLGEAFNLAFKIALQQEASM